MSSYPRNLWTFLTNQLFTPWIKIECYLNQIGWSRKQSCIEGHAKRFKKWYKKIICDFFVFSRYGFWWFNALQTRFVWISIKKAKKHFLHNYKCVSYIKLNNMIVDNKRLIKNNDWCENNLWHFYNKSSTIYNHVSWSAAIPELDRAQQSVVKKTGDRSEKRDKGKT